MFLMQKRRYKFIYFYAKAIYGQSLLCCNGDTFHHALRDVTCTRQAAASSLFGRHFESIFAKVLQTVLLCCDSNQAIAMITQSDWHRSPLSNGE